MRANVAAIASAPRDRSLRRWSDPAAIALLTLTVSLIYGARLGLQPLVGEETRWATAAREMLATGDWIVPRQQGRVFPERPPMTMWAMAAAGYLRGDVDAIAVRLPSVIAVVLTSLLVYAYARAFSSIQTAAASALIYSTMGQVLQIGSRGESEAAFALLVSASLLLWHLGYMRRRRPLAVWSIGFAFAALAALVKGPQAPVYFGAITVIYLLVQRDLRYLISWQFAAGAAVFATIVAAWQFPFYLATDWDSVAATWTGLAGDRIRLGGVLAHIVTFPAETFVCLLPWSPWMLTLVSRKSRNLFSNQRPVFTFLATALIVAYPTVWLAAGARGRYFMPLYPLAAVLIGLLIERSAVAARDVYPRRAWHQFLLIWSSVIGVSALVIGGSSLLLDDPIRTMYQPRAFCLLYALVAAGVAYMLWLCYRQPNNFRPITAVIAIAGIAGLGTGGFMVNVNAARWNNPTADVVDFKSLLPTGASLVSFTPIEHRFAYYYREPVAELDWPLAQDDLPPNVEYFCFMRNPGDTAKSRLAGRGRTTYHTSGTLPFAWQEITSICVDRRVYDDHPRTVVLGRVVRPLQPTISDVTVPQSSITQRPTSLHRK